MEFPHNVGEVNQHKQTGSMDRFPYRIETLIDFSAKSLLSFNQN